MNVNLCQRWHKRTQRFRPAGERIKPREYEVALITKDLASPFVVEHHYLAEFVAASLCMGLYRLGQLVGVGAFGSGVNPEATFNVFDAPASVCTELLRLVLLDSVPGDGESWFIARAREDLAALGVACLLSHADPVPRATSTGQSVFRGHVGTIYKASNMLYLGRSRARWVRVLPSGKLFHERALAKLRKKESRWQSAARPLVEAGAPSPGADPSPTSLRAWVAEWVPRLTRPLWHTGNHKYALPLVRGVSLRPGVEVVAYPPAWRVA